MCAFVFLRYGGTRGTLSPHEPVNTCPEKGTSSLEMTCLRGLRITRGMYAISISWVVPWVSAYDDAQNRVALVEDRKDESSAESGVHQDSAG